MPPWMYSDTQPCGTPAAAKRHQRNDEPLCRACRQAEVRRWREQNPPKRAATRRAHAADGGSIGWQPGFAVDVMALLDLCEAIDGPSPAYYRELEPGF